MTKAEAIYGIAYREVYGLLDPDGCTDDEKRQQLAVEAVKLYNWANSQALEYKSPWNRAIHDIVERADVTLENNNRARFMEELAKTIPMPPKPEPEPLPIIIEPEPPKPISEETVVGFSPVRMAAE